jgi:hypothetical protein
VKCLEGPSFRVLVIDLMESTSSVLGKSDATHMGSISFLVVSTGAAKDSFGRSVGTVSQ